MKRKHTIVGLAMLNTKKSTFADKLIFRAHGRGIVDILDNVGYFPIIDKETDEPIAAWVPIMGRGIVVRFLVWLSDKCRVVDITEYDPNYKMTE